MGGNALKKTYTRRYSREEFDLIHQEILSILIKFFRNVDVPKFYQNKDSFGDIDFVCSDPIKSGIDIKEFLKNEFGYNEIFINSNTYSFDYRCFQVDLIIVGSDLYETTLKYLNYNDLGNLVGKVAHKFGLKYGTFGLKYPYRLDGKMMGDIEISKDHRKVLEFLGFDPDVYDRGFNDLNEIFEYVVSSKYFDPWMFDLENLNRINRERDKKRKTYSEFLKYVEKFKEGKTREDYYYFHPDKRVYLGLIDETFPGTLRKYRNLEKKEERKRLVSSLYNGNILMNRFGLSGKDLGSAIGKFEKSFESKEVLENWIIEVSDTDIILDKFNEVVFSNG